MEEPLKPDNIQSNTINSTKAIREDPKLGVVVSDLTEHRIESLAELQAWFQLGIKHRKIASTEMNRTSSRSHSVFSIFIQHPGLPPVQLNFIDLAGSERQSHTGAAGTQLKEACQINQSLSTLGKVINALAMGSSESEIVHRHIPYRESKLTFLLKNSLGGNAKAIFIANLSSAKKWSGETLSTLQFASRAKFIKNKSRIVTTP